MNQSKVLLAFISTSSSVRERLWIVLASIGFSTLIYLYIKEELEVIILKVIILQYIEPYRLGNVSFQWVRMFSLMSTEGCVR
jgi:hypothetical protein